jgi:hypothetical protein
VTDFLYSTHLCNRLVPSSPASPELETSGSKGRSAHPACNGYSESGHTQHNERVHAGDLSSPSVDVLVRDDGRGHTHSDDRSDDGCSEVDEAALPPEIEETVPGQDLGGWRRRRSGFARGGSMSDGLRFALGGNATGGDVGCDRRTDLLQWRRGCGEEGLGGSRRSEDAVELGGCAEAAAPGDRGSGHDGRRVCCSRRCYCAGRRLRWSMACDAQRELERARRCCGACAPSKCATSNTFNLALHFPLVRHGQCIYTLCAVSF